ncbi:MAG: hypothetical protein K9L85_01575 [Candidatus Peribacteraceae bacterium]|nr:hypothetical protein [Candidatus Peribacteraceae bacterium]
MQNQKNKTSKSKAFLGGVLALGIFASFFAFDGGIFATDKLSADVSESSPAESEADIPAITAIEPQSGAVGEAVSILIENLESLDRETSGAFFGDTPADIEAVDQSAGLIVAFVRVPELESTGSYPIKITTADGLIESAVEFEVTAVSDLAPAPDEEAPVEKEAPTETETTGGIEEVEPDFSADFSVPEIPGAETMQAGAIEENLDEPAQIVPLFSGTAPGNLTAQSTESGILLSWSGNADNKYRVYYGTTSGRYIHRVESENTSIVLNSNFINGTRYFFLVSALDSSGIESSGSNEASAVYSPYAAPIATQLRPSAMPPKLSEQGPAETLVISLLLTFGIALLIFRRKIFARN